jgi:uncharacterized membrane protein
MCLVNSAVIPGRGAEYFIMFIGMCCFFHIALEAIDKESKRVKKTLGPEPDAMEQVDGDRMAALQTAYDDLLTESTALRIH